MSQSRECAQRRTLVDANAGLANTASHHAAKLAPEAGRHARDARLDVRARPDGNKASST
jgi:hypothetical protein